VLSHRPESPSPSGPANAITPDLYAFTKAGMLSTTAALAKPAVYVPNLSDGTVTVIDPKTYHVVDTIKVGVQPQHVVPAWDLKTLWVNNNAGNSLTPIDPVTAKRQGPDVAVDDPYNLYFTPDGSSAIVMAEAKTNVDFRDPHTMKLQQSLHLGSLCAGVNHADFSPDGTYMIVTCEFSGRLAKIDLKTRKVIGWLDLGSQSAPQDIKIDPFGQIWYVADMNADGVYEITGDDFKKVGFLKTGLETHGLYPSRDGTRLYVSNRGGERIPGAAFSQHAGNLGSVSVIDFKTRTVVATWTIPGGGTPDMGNVSADGKTLWLSGRRSNEVYVFDTSTGTVIARIPAGDQPHGLCVWPQPGRYSLGHTGILR
jgi:YVTN family beta-propeller protein